MIDQDLIDAGYIHNNRNNEYTRRFEDREGYFCVRQYRTENGAYKWVAFSAEKHVNTNELNRHAVPWYWQSAHEAEGDTPFEAHCALINKIYEELEHGRG
jgi:hypothetical protein